MKLKASPLQSVSLRCAFQSPSTDVYTAQIARRSPLRQIANGITCCALAITTALLVGCGDGLIGPSSLTGSDIVTGDGSLSAPPVSPQDPTVVSSTQCGSGLAAHDLTGQCRAVPATPGALEASDGTSVAGLSVVPLAVPQAASRLLQVSWQPFGNDTSGYVVYFGKTADTTNVLVSDLPTDSGLFDPSAPTVTYNSVRDLGLYSGDTVCFRIYAYNLARTLVGEVSLGCSMV